MKNQWSDDNASEFVEKYSKEWGEDLALRTYTSQLIGAEKELVLHGGGNTSVKNQTSNLLGEMIDTIYVKASGYDLVNIGPEGHTGVNLNYLKQLGRLQDLSDEHMVNELLTHRLDARAKTPSIEALMHAFIPAKYVDHTHADAILALTNQPGGVQQLKEALGDSVIIIDYVKPGFSLAKAVLNAVESSPNSIGIILMKHGLVTWGESARESYERTIELVTKAEKFLDWRKPLSNSYKNGTSFETTAERFTKVAPIIRGALALPSENADQPYDRFILKHLFSQDIINIIDSKDGKDIALTPPLTSDHLIRTKSLPLWIDNLNWDDEENLRAQITSTVSAYEADYKSYLDRHTPRLKPGLDPFDPMPRLILTPGLGAICVGPDINEAEIVSDITTQTLITKARITLVGEYEGLQEEQLFDMEYFSLQHAKLDKEKDLPLKRSIALITGAAGAIGAGICYKLLENGCHVAVSDLPGDNLEALVDELKQQYGSRIIGIPLDVTDTESVSKGFSTVINRWGGVDLIIINAGIAHVSNLADMDPEVFRKLEKVNIDGTLHILSEASRFFKIQGTGGDIILVSTKNVFSPSANFGAYSATKAASHQLARIASLELAPIGVRVNMVSPDGIFSHGKHKSGLWALVGPDRMRARNLDQEGLEAYYQNRNLLKAKITATHVANAVMYFATRQSPTTGATIPVDGGLPDATPR
ncbi:bifunctional aldolase/short-chain dehydrogenase [Bacteroidota bacterium]